MLSETKIIEVWRRKYLMQAIVVLFLAIMVLAVGWYNFNYWGLKLLWSIVFLLITYVMIRTIREELQTKGENLFFSNKALTPTTLIFDVGRGIDEKTLVKQEIVENYQVRECRNILRGRDFLFEEDWFYDISSFKSLKFNQDVFEGVILRVNVTSDVKDLKGHIEIKNGKTVVYGEIAEFLKIKNSERVFKDLFNLFGVSVAQVVIQHHQAYIWLKTEKRLFYQFSLFKINSFVAFGKRVLDLQNVAEELKKVF